MSEENKAPTPSEPAAAPSEAPAPVSSAPAPAAPSPSHSAPSQGRPSRPPGRGPRSDRPGGGPGGPRRGKRQFFRKKKVCRFCADRADFIDYKKADVLRGFVQERGKILPRRMTGTCSRHQRWLGEAIKRARNIALLPFGSQL
ncbi:MAG TPA: 30S ribosomal protein S18 [Candidatus Acidoferrales bacterium]